MFTLISCKELVMLFTWRLLSNSLNFCTLSWMINHFVSLLECRTDRLFFLICSGFGPDYERVRMLYFRLFLFSAQLWDCHSSGKATLKTEPDPTMYFYICDL